MHFGTISCRARSLSKIFVAPPMSEIRLNSSLFTERTKALSEKLSRPLLILLGKAADSQDFTMNSALFHYLLGYEFPETILVLQNPPLVITSPKKALILRQISPIQVVVRNKDDSNFKEILSKLTDEYFVVDPSNARGPFCETVLSTIKHTDASIEVRKLISLKDPSELSILRRSASAANYLLIKGINLIRDDEFSKEGLESFMNDHIQDVDNDYIEYSFNPEYSFDPTRESNHFRLGLRYRGYCSEIARPFLTDLASYYDIQAYALEIIQPGKDSSLVLKDIRQYIQKCGYPHYIKIYTIGLLSFEIDFEEGFELERSICFVINIDDKFANTFILESVPLQITRKDRNEDYSKRQMRFRNKTNDVNLQNEIKEHQRILLEELLEERISYHKRNMLDNPANAVEISKIAKYERDASVPRSDKITFDWDKMYVILPVLSYSVPFHISTIKNVSMSGSGPGTYLRINFKQSKDISDLGAINLAKNEYVYANKEFEEECEFDENEPCSPKTEFSESRIDLAGKYDFDTTLKSINIKTAVAEEMVMKINEMRKEYAKPTMNLKSQEELKELNKKVALIDLYSRMDSKSTNKKVLATLELHANGLKYNNVVILFSNIKNVFFVEGTSETRTLLHFNLKEFINVGGKPTLNIQFFRQYNIGFHDTNRREDDRLEMVRLQEEEAELCHINDEFSEFITHFERATSQSIQMAEYSPGLSVQIPEYAFLGVHSKEAVRVGVSRDCLVAIEEQPFFILNLDEVEVVNFERITFMTKTFDCVFVFRDKKRPVTALSSIEMTRLPFVKELLDSHNIIFMETKVNINWNNLMQTILKDPLSFYENGGWSELLRADDDDEESGTTEEDDESYETEDSTVSSTTIDEEEDESVDDSVSETDSDLTSDSDESSEEKTRRKRKKK